LLLGEHSVMLAAGNELILAWDCADSFLWCGNFFHAVGKATPT